jgi:predicted alpha/beta-fold hydrolase
VGAAADLASYMRSVNLCSLGGELMIPLASIHAEDDPLVPVSHAMCLQESATGNPHVAVMVTGNGGHWGFTRAYGRQWVRAVLEKVLAAGR